jgi:ABC-type nitrate/sulfonate/bicarbonate transport system permease component
VGKEAAVSVDAQAPGPVDLGPSLLRNRLRTRRRTAAERICLSVGTPVLLLVLWQVLVETGVLKSAFFPTPVTVIHDIISQLSNAAGLHEFGGDLGQTAEASLIGFAIGGVAGVVIGSLMGMFRFVRYALSPTIIGTFPTPKVTLFPLCVVLFGLGPRSAIALAAVTCFYLVCINTAAGVRAIQATYQEVGRSFRVPPLNRYLKIILPAAWPATLTGLRLGAGAALGVVLIVEFIDSTTGMGAYIWNASQGGDVGEMFVGLVTIALLGGVVFLIGGWLDRLTASWSRPRG